MMGLMVTGLLALSLPDAEAVLCFLFYSVAKGIDLFSLLNFICYHLMVLVCRFFYFSICCFIYSIPLALAVISALIGTFQDDKGKRQFFTFAAVGFGGCLATFSL